jgi:cyclophilin family peptidyl-prolyl cis-trans isomerase
MKFSSLHVYYLFVLGLMLVFATSCVPVSQKNKEIPAMEFSPDFTISGHQIIYTYQDKLATDSLLLYFNVPNERLRYLAVKAMAAVKDKKALPQLFEKLRDSSFAVRNVAAYAIGQIGDIRGEKPLTDAFINFDSIPGFQELNATIMEALGKCGSAATLKLMAEVNTYLPSDTLLLEGQLRCFYQFGLRNIFHPSAKERSIDLLTNPNIPYSAKILCAQYLHRFSAIELEDKQEELFEWYQSVNDEWMKAYVIPIIMRIKHPQSKNIATEVFVNNSSDVIKINVVQALRHLKYEEADELINKYLLKSPDEQFVELGCEYYLHNGKEPFTKYYLNLVDSIPNNYYVAKATLLAAAARYTSPSDRVFQAKIGALLSIATKNSTILDDEKRRIVQLMGNSPECLVPLKSLLVDNNQSIIIRSAAAEGLGTLAALSQFNSYFKFSATDVKVFIVKYLVQSMMDVSSGLVASCAAALSDTNAGLRLYIPDTINYIRLRESLILPEQSEDYIELLKLERFVKGDFTKVEWNPEYNNPIDWPTIIKLPDTIFVKMDTPRGSITFEMYKNDAPGTVNTLYRLLQDGFYNDKIFHRVVPNFVAQGGCTRGDGYGSLNLSIRTEIVPWQRFNQAGVLGMASAGNHTESQQFFATLGPTPHLDGKYSIFGRIVEGLDVLYKIRRGDKILNAKVIR